MSSDLKVFANKIAKIPFLKNILKPFYYSYKNRMEAKRNEQFQQYALQLLKDFDKCMTSHGFDYSLAYGSMLGAVREHGFIKHDLDIDVFMWAKDYSEDIDKILIEAGFSRLHRFVVDNGKLGREDTYTKYDVSIDIFYVYEGFDEKGDYTCAFAPYPGYITWENSQKLKGGVKVQRWFTPMSHNFIRVKFESLDLNISSNYDELLRMVYGDEYMIPNPSYNSYNSPYYTEWPDVNGIVL